MQYEIFHISYQVILFTNLKIEKQLNGSGLKSYIKHNYQM